MTKKEKAAELHARGCNCCQAVACAFAKEIGVDEKILFQAGEGFGLGMGCMDGVCGALSGAVMVAGFANSSGDPAQPTTKGATYKLAGEMTKRFRDAAGSTICRELKGIDTGAVLCSCPACIDHGVRVAEEVLRFSDTY